MATGATVASTTDLTTTSLTTSTTTDIARNPLPTQEGDASSDDDTNDSSDDDRRQHNDSNDDDEQATATTTAGLARLDPGLANRGGLCSFEKDCPRTPQIPTCKRQVGCDRRSWADAQFPVLSGREPPVHPHKMRGGDWG